MAPVDIQASQWKRGEFDNDAGKIRRVLLDVLSAQEKKS